MIRLRGLRRRQRVCRKELANFLGNVPNLTPGFPFRQFRVTTSECLQELLLIVARLGQMHRRMSLLYPHHFDLREYRLQQLCKRAAPRYTHNLFMEFERHSTAFIELTFLQMRALRFDMPLQGANLSFRDPLSGEPRRHSLQMPRVPRRSRWLCSDRT